MFLADLLPWLQIGDHCFMGSHLNSVIVLSKIPFSCFHNISVDFNDALIQGCQYNLSV